MKLHILFYQYQFRVQQYFSTMAKSLRSKVKRRFRGLKSRYLNDIKSKPQTEQLNSRCQKGLAGIEYRQKQKKNAFLHPEDTEAHFPQYKAPPIIDLRSASIPGSGLQWSGATRKKQKIIPHLDQVPNKRPKQMSDNEQSMSEQKVNNKPNNSEMREQRIQAAKKKKKVSKLKKTIVF